MVFAGRRGFSRERPPSPTPPANATRTPTGYAEEGHQQLALGQSGRGWQRRFRQSVQYQECLFFSCQFQFQVQVVLKRFAGC